MRSIKVSPLYPKQLYRSVQYGATAPKSTTMVCPVHNFPPPSKLLVCYQPQPCRVKSLYMKRFWDVPTPDQASPSANGLGGRGVPVLLPAHACVQGGY
jgi:hypothetical protein